MPLTSRFVPDNVALEIKGGTSVPITLMIPFTPNWFVFHERPEARGGS